MRPTNALAADQQSVALGEERRDGSIHSRIERMLQRKQLSIQALEPRRDEPIQHAGAMARLRGAQRNFRHIDPRSERSERARDCVQRHCVTPRNSGEQGRDAGVQVHFKRTDVVGEHCVGCSNNSTGVNRDRCALAGQPMGAGDGVDQAEMWRRHVEQGGDDIARSGGGADSADPCRTTAGHR